MIRQPSTGVSVTAISWPASSASNRIAQFGAGFAGRRAAEPLAVVDPAAIADFVIGIDEHGRGRPLDAARRDAAAVDILHERKRHVVLDGLRRDFEHRVVRPDIDRHELHALVAKLLVQLLEPRQESLHDRAGRVREHEHERPLPDGIFSLTKSLSDRGKIANIGERACRQACRRSAAFGRGGARCCCRQTPIAAANSMADDDRDHGELDESSVNDRTIRCVLRTDGSGLSRKVAADGQLRNMIVSRSHMSQQSISAASTYEFRVRFTNFGGNQSFRPASVFAPRNEAELLDVLRTLPRPANSRDRPAPFLERGAGCRRCAPRFAAFSGRARRASRRPALGDGRRRLPDQTAAGRTERQEAGTLPSLGLITEQTIAGAISTGTHGSGKPSMSHFVDEVRVATYDAATGEPVIRTINSRRRTAGRALLARRDGSDRFRRFLVAAAVTTSRNAFADTMSSKACWRRKMSIRCSSFF